VGGGTPARRRVWRRPYAVRRPGEYRLEGPGDLVEVDTLGVRPLPGVVLKHFTARDVVSRRDVLEVHTRPAATTMGFLGTLQARFPLPTKAIQTDGGEAAFLRGSLPGASQLPAWEHTHDTLRPHQALGPLTPLQFLTRYTSQRR